MNLYDANHPGLTLSLQELGTLNLTGSRPLGFFRSADLHRMMNRSILAAGIRVYLAGENAQKTGSSSLVACGTKADGFDANEFNGLTGNSPTKDPIFMRVKRPNLSLAADQLSRAAAKQEVTTDTFLTAFFSEATIFDLLSAPGAQGISFFTAPLDPIESKVPELFPFPVKYQALSFLAVARSEANANSPFQPASETRTILSNLPCPGHCLSIGVNNMFSRGAVARSPTNFNRAPYINPWEDEDGGS
ncbi:MAG: hypothetical protein AAGA31_12535 [Bacteroidota bacterium]